MNTMLARWIGHPKKTFLVLLMTGIGGVVVTEVSMKSNTLEQAHMDGMPLGISLPINNRPRILAIGQGFAVGVKSDGTVWSWGTNFHDAYLGRQTASRNEELKPGRISGLSDAVSVVSSSGHTLVLRKDGSVWSWGENDHGQLGYPTQEKYSGVPQQIPGLDSVVDISAQLGVSQVLKSNGTVWGFGWGADGRLGGAAQKDMNPLMQIEGLKNIVRIELGRGVSLAIDSSGRLWSYGEDRQRLGRSLEPTQLTFVPDIVPLPKRVVDVSANAQAVYALLDDGSVWSWGYNNAGQLGTGERDERGRSTPAKISTISSVTRIASGMGGAAVTESGSIVTWGTSAGGPPRAMTVRNLWTPHFLKEELPTPITFLVGGEAYAAVDANGGVWFWQGNSRGLRGTGTVIDDPTVDYWVTPEKSLWSFK